MDPFVRRLVERMLAPGQPLSRNRHFHTFETKEGKRALLVVRRLEALKDDLEACRAEGGTCRVEVDRTTGTVHLELSRRSLRTRRRSTLKLGEFEVFCTLPGVEAALAQTSGER